MFPKVVSSGKGFPSFSSRQSADCQWCRQEEVGGVRRGDHTSVLDRVDYSHAHPAPPVSPFRGPLSNCPVGKAPVAIVG